MGPSTDPHPPVLHSTEWQLPIPLPGPINTAGAEDSPFITPDGETFLFFFTPEARIPPEQQLLDGVTGLYLSHRVGDRWGEPVRLILQDSGELSLDGCGFLQGEVLWFCSARAGNLREIDLWLADLRGDRASNWRNAGHEINREIGAGEMHLSADGQALYFHAPRPGAGDLDLYVSRRSGEAWAAAEPLAPLNTEASEGWPFLSEDGTELWFTRFTQGAPAIFRSRWTGGDWSPPELILSSFAGEPTLDRLGNLYFVHHYVVDGVIVEADIYFCAPS
jgi:ribosomal protein L24E